MGKARGAFRAYSCFSSPVPQPAALMEAALGRQSISAVGLVRVAVTVAAGRGD